VPGAGCGGLCSAALGGGRGLVMNGLQKKIICKALDAVEELTEWEHEFISDLAEKPESYELSEKQNHQLNRIWGKLE
jgi:hypothetical protein